jgi:hypothetical protein
MSLNLSAIGNTIWSNVSWATSGTVALARQSLTTGRQFFSSARPALAGVVAKIRSVDVSTYRAVATSFMKTDAGVAMGMLAVGIITCVLSTTREDTSWKTAWAAAGVASFTISAGFATNTSWLKPSFLRV